MFLGIQVAKALGAYFLFGVFQHFETTGFRILEKIRMNSGFRREVGENSALLGFYAASSGNFLPTFRDNLSILYSGVKNKKKIGPVGCPETSLRNYHYSLLNDPEERSSQIRVQFLTFSKC